MIQYKTGPTPSGSPEQTRKGCRIWQLSESADVKMRFLGYMDLVSKFGQPDAGNYTQVFDGVLGTEDLEKIYLICRNNPPSGYRGHRMSVSDVVELYDDAGRNFYFCDRIGFRPIRFEKN